MPTEFKLDQGAMRRLLTGPSSEPVKLIRKAQRRTINAAKTRAPVDTGQLRMHHKAGDITVRGTVVSTDVTATQDYAAAVHEGMKARVIRPKRAKVLSWVGPKGRVFASSVKHPGTKPRPWLLNAARASAGALGFEVTDGG